MASFVATKLRRRKPGYAWAASRGLGTFTSFVTMRRFLGGFTLIELLFVMAVIAILSSLALPSYQHTQ